MQKKVNRRKRVLYLILFLLLFIIVSFLIQRYLMPKWHDGNTQSEQTADNGLHEQYNQIETEETAIDMTYYIRDEANTTDVL